MILSVRVGKGPRFILLSLKVTRDHHCFRYDLSSLVSLWVVDNPQMWFRSQMWYDDL